MEKRKLNILVLAGGESAEREVSLDSSRAIAKSLIDDGHDVRVVDLLDLPVQDMVAIRSDDTDVVFLGLHGGMGENGSIQAALEMLGMTYTGSPMAASAVAMNKDISKRVMQTLGIPTAEWFSLKATGNVDELISEVRAQHAVGSRKLPAFPFIVKPTDGGSTVGLSLVENAEQLPDAIRGTAKESDLILIEDYIEGREITIAVLDGQALPPVEIKPTHKLYDYDCKYTKGKSEYFCPADIDAEIVEKLSRDAVRFYNTIGCRGYGRVDFIVAPDDSYVCLELNTLPGMTELSLFPMAARAAGIEFGELLERICLLALEGR